MKNRGKNIGLLLTGMAVGAALCGGAYAAGIVAQPTWQPIFVDGQQVEMEAYNINGNNYVKLRDIGKEVGFNVYWQDGVQVDSDADYTGEPLAATAPTVSDAISSDTKDLDAVKQEIVDLTNALRKEHGLDALGTSDLLMRAAQVRAEEMAATGNYSHVRPDGRKYYTVTDCSQTTENIHRINQEWLKTTGKTLAEAAVDDWAASQGHLDHMMSKTVYMVGVGIAEGTNAAGEPCWYCVQEFCPNGYAVSWVDDPALS